MRKDCGCASYESGSRPCLASATQLTTLRRRRSAGSWASPTLRNLPSQPHFDCEARRLLNPTSSHGFRVSKVVFCCITSQNNCQPDSRRLPETNTKHHLDSGVQLESALPATETFRNALFATVLLLMTHTSSALRSIHSRVCIFPAHRARWRHELHRTALKIRPVARAISYS
jgi:hypothetical protein